MRYRANNVLADENRTGPEFSLVLLSPHELNDRTVLSNRSEETKKNHTDHQILYAMKSSQQGISQLPRHDTVTLLRRRLQLSRRWTRITKNQTVDNQWKLNQTTTTLSQSTTRLIQPCV